MVAVGADDGIDPLAPMAREVVHRHDAALGRHRLDKLLGEAAFVVGVAAPARDRVESRSEGGVADALAGRDRAGPGRAGAHTLTAA